MHEKIAERQVLPSELFKRHVVTYTNTHGKDKKQASKSQIQGFFSAVILCVGERPATDGEYQKATHDHRFP